MKKLICLGFFLCIALAAHAENFRIEPADAYNDEHGTVKIKYVSYTQMVEEERVMGDQLMLTPEEISKKIEELPRGGMIGMFFDRPTINTAVPKNFTYIAKINDKEIVRKTGRDVVPDPRKYSNLWTAVDLIYIKEDFGKRLDFFIVDQVYRKRYDFKIIK